MDTEGSNQPPLMPQQVLNSETPISHTATSPILTVCIVLTLIFVYPLGIILMWILMHSWPRWAKILITSPVVILIGGYALMVIFLSTASPNKQFALANDTKRRGDIQVIKNALNQYKAESGSYPPGISSTKIEISSSGANLCSSLAPKYLAQFPTDPLVPTSGIPVPLPCPTTYKTGYFVQLASDNTITVYANGQINKNMNSSANYGQ